MPCPAPDFDAHDPHPADEDVSQEAVALAAPAPRPWHGRGALSNAPSRFERWSREREVAPSATDADADADADALEDADAAAEAPSGEWQAPVSPTESPVASATHDSWQAGSPGPAAADEGGSGAASTPQAPRRATTIAIVDARSIVSRNDSPDIPFDQSINPYLGCEHGCIYCYARPTHEYWGLSAGLDFETRLSAKANAAARLEATFASQRYRASLIALGTATDPYQPIERKLQITRQILGVMDRWSHPVGITTKSALVLRDIDLLASLAQRELVQVWISLGSLDRNFARMLEPRAASPTQRLRAIERLAQAGVPVAVSISPVIPALSDPQIEKVLSAAANAGASRANYALLRLPGAVQALFTQWLDQHHPQRGQHVLSVLAQMHGGQVYDPSFGARMRGSGPFADLVEQRFDVACRKAGLGRDRVHLRTDLFAPPKDVNASEARSGYVDGGAFPEPSITGESGDGVPHRSTPPGAPVQASLF